MNNPNDPGMHPEDRRNLFLFMILAVILYFGFDAIVLQPRMEAMRVAQQQEALERQARLAETPDASIEIVPTLRSRDEVVSEGLRVQVSNDLIFGSINLVGARIDDIRLRNHYVTLERERHVSIMTPPGVEHARFAEYGWVPASDDVSVPGPKSVWRVRGDSKDAELTPDSPVTLFWENGQGLTFERTLTLDADFLFTMTERVINSTGKAVTLYPYALISQRGMPEDFTGRWIMHEGPIGHIHDELMEKPYSDLKERGTIEVAGQKGWIGVTEKYWLVSILPPQDGDKTFRFVYKPKLGDEEDPLYQVDVLGPAQTAAAGGELVYENRLFAGAKRLKTLEMYEKNLGVRHFDLAIDFGMYYFLTKPFYYILIFFYGVVGNFGIAILMLTVVLRAAVFPLANTSYRSFANMRKIAPQMKELRDRFGDDKAKLQQELVELYQREKVNPMAGCLPIVAQIPIFFALFKVLQLSIEMRHAPFFGWIQDLSAPDPTTVFNLFGLLPYSVPGPLMIGAWPCFMLITMILQRSMQPPPQDKQQAFIINFMPWFMVYIMSKFAAGLVIYWTFSNMLAIVQQYVIMRSLGVEVKFFQFRRPKEDREMEKAVAEGPAVHPGLEVAEHEIEEAMFGEGEEERKPVTPPRPKKKKKKK